MRKELKGPIASHCSRQRSNPIIGWVKTRVGAYWRSRGKVIPITSRGDRKRVRVSHDRTNVADVVNAATQVRRDPATGHGASQYIHTTADLTDKPSQPFQPDKIAVSLCYLTYGRRADSLTVDSLAHNMLAGSLEANFHLVLEGRKVVRRVRHWRTGRFGLIDMQDYPVQLLESVDGRSGIYRQGSVQLNISSD